MKAILRPRPIIYLRVLLYPILFVPVIIMAVLAPLWWINVIMGVGSIFLIWLFVSGIIDSYRYQIEVSDHEVILPYPGFGVDLPVDIDGKVIGLPGLEIENDIVKIPYFDGKRITVPLKKLGGVWKHKDAKGLNLIVFSTDAYDVSLVEKTYNKEKLFNYLEKNFPDKYYQKPVRSVSVVNESKFQSLEMILDDRNQEISKNKKSVGYLIFISLMGLFFGYAALYFLILGTWVNVCVPFVFFLMFIVHVINNIGEKEVIVDKERIQYRFRKKYHEILWAEIESITMVERLVLRGKDKQFSIPKDLVKTNQLFVYLLETKNINGNLHIKAPWYSRIFNK